MFTSNLNATSCFVEQIFHTEVRNVFHIEASFIGVGLSTRFLFLSKSVEFLVLDFLEYFGKF